MSETPANPQENQAETTQVENDEVTDKQEPKNTKGKKQFRKDKRRDRRFKKGKKDKEDTNNNNEKDADDDNDEKEADADNDNAENKEQKEAKPQRQNRKDIFEEVEEAPEERILFYAHPDELWLKGKNKESFVQALQENIILQLKRSGLTTGQFRVSHIRDETFFYVIKEKEEIAIDTVKRVFGIANFGRCYHVKRDIEILKTECLSKFTAFYNNNKSHITNFKCNCSRQDKQFELNSVDICKIIGEVIFNGLKLPAKMKDPDINIYIEVRNKFFLYYFEKFEGAHGLPVSTSGRSVVLLSGGFDSPVAAWTVMRRGCAVRYVHFHSAPYGDWKGSVSKVRKIVQALSAWGGPEEFYSVPIGEQQRIIAKDAPEKLRVTLYRRLMFRIAHKIAGEIRCSSLVTGDSLGQVASQTVESMTTIQSVIAPFLVLRPLIGKNKTSIIKRARKIGTHDLSILPAGDCCSHMLPKNPSTRPSIENAVEGEKKLNIEEMINNAISNMQKINVNEPWNEDEDNDDNEGMTCPFDIK